MGVHPSCEMILAETEGGVVPSLKVTVRKQKEMRIVKIVVDGSMIELIPTIPTAIPKVKADDKEQKITEVLKIKLSNGHIVELIWIPEETSLYLSIKDKAIAMSLTAGRTIHLRLNPFVYHSRVRGMCGNMDSEIFNEMQTPERILVKNPELLAMTWIVPGTNCREGCPLKRTPVELNKSSRMCVPIISLPKCMCGRQRSTVIKDVPMRCPNNRQIILSPLNVLNLPIKCEV